MEWARTNASAVHSGTNQSAGAENQVHIHGCTTYTMLREPLFSMLTPPSCDTNDSNNKISSLSGIEVLSGLRELHADANNLNALPAALGAFLLRESHL